MGKRRSLVSKRTPFWRMLQRTGQCTFGIVESTIPGKHQTFQRLCDLDRSLRVWTKAGADVDFNFYNFFIDIQIQPLHVAAYDGLSELMEVMCLFTKECLTKSNE